MVLCYLCNTNIPTITGLRLHFDMFHSNDNVTQYKCIEEGCQRTFQLFFSFKRHYLKEHSSLNCLQNETVLNRSPHNQSVVEIAHTVNDGSITTFSSSTVPGISIPDPSKRVEKSLSEFLSLLYADPILPRSSVDMVITGVQKFVSNALVPAIQHCADDAVTKDHILQETSDVMVNNLTKLITAPFDTFNTERKRLNYFKESGTYMPPQSIVIGQRFDSRKSEGVNRMELVDCVQQFIPLRHVLKRFFLLDHLLCETLQYVEGLAEQSDVIENFIQGSFWQSKKDAHNGRVVFPLFIYFDDYETGNVLGSHSGVHKLGAVYVSVACLPPQRQSALSNIFLSLLFHSGDRTQFGNNVIFKPLIDELNFLSEVGIDIHLPTYSGTVYFETGLILGDNLGIHSITGFVESFSSNFSCRVCKIEKNVLHKQVYEDETLLRNSDNYAADLLLGNPSLTGIKEKCVWLEIKGFDLFQQVGVDFMHDVLEGVAKYVLSFMIVTFVETFKFFSLETMNDRITTFPYGPDMKNKPCSLEFHNLKNDNVRLSASEMLTFLRFFGLIVGEFVPKDNCVWSLYITLRKILDLLLMKSVSAGAERYLQTLIAELNEKYISLTNGSLKPKFHNLTHYHSALHRFGPLVKIWSMRFEAKHRPSKLSAKASCNRRNITLTLAMKHQLQLNEIFCREQLDNSIEIGPFCFLSEFEANEVKSQLGLDNSKVLNCVKWVSVMSTWYGKGIILAHCLEEDGYLVYFLSVTKVYLYDSKILVLSGTKLKTECFDEHYYAYEVVPDDDVNPIFVMHSKLLSYLPNAKPFSVNNKNYVVLRGPV